MNNEQSDHIPEGSDAGVPRTPGNGNAASIPQRSQSLANERSGPGTTVETKVKQPLRLGKASGPRSAEGKQRSRHNATKHGIFSSVVLLEGEPSSEFNSLLIGLEKHFHPKGALEKSLVDRLGSLFWRLWRHHIAETAEIRTRIAFPVVPRRNEGHQPGTPVYVRVIREGENEDNERLMERVAYPEVLRRCLELLRDLKRRIESDGLNHDRDLDILTKLYGKYANKNERGTLFKKYRTCVSIANYSEEERKKNGFASPEQCVRNLLEDIEEEIRRLELDKSIESKRMSLEALRQNVPDAPQYERLLRYEAALERFIDRTLSQLERLQRMRRGHSVPPPLKVEVSGLEEGH